MTKVESTKKDMPETDLDGDKKEFSVTEVAEILKGLWNKECGQFRKDIEDGHSNTESERKE